MEAIGVDAWAKEGFIYVNHANFCDTEQITLLWNIFLPSVY